MVMAVFFVVNEVGPVSKKSSEARENSTQDQPLRRGV
jgi:hypothetical protein